MNGNKTSARVLRSEILKTMELLERNYAYYRKFLNTDFKLLGKKNSTAIVIAEIITDYYTCLETAFLRISQFFENNLNCNKWHKSLLDKMIINIEGVRIAVISDQSHKLLLELLKFRHFRRYYFDLEYDWDRIIFLQKKYETANNLVKKDLTDFIAFLDRLAGTDDGQAPSAVSPRQ